MPSTICAFASAPPSTPRTPSTAAASSMICFFASASSAQTTTSASSGPPLSSFFALRFWNAATTFAPGSSACSCCAADPSGTESSDALPPSNAMGTTVLTTILPARADASGGSVAACAVYGVVTMTMSAEAAASSFVAAVSGSAASFSCNSATAVCAFSIAREPMTHSCPAFAKRYARPMPSSPVPPMNPIFTSSPDSDNPLGASPHPRRATSH